MLGIKKCKQVRTANFRFKTKSYMHARFCSDFTCTSFEFYKITFQSSSYNTLGTFVAGKKKCKLVLMGKSASRHFYPFFMSYTSSRIKKKTYIKTLLQHSY